MGDGGDPLDMVTEHSSKRLGLGFAQLRELLGDVRDRAVMLTNLCAAGCRLSACRKSQLTQCLRKSLEFRRQWLLLPVRAQGVSQGRFEFGGPGLRELRNSVGADRRFEETQCLGRERVVVRAESGTSGSQKSRTYVPGRPRPRAGDGPYGGRSCEVTRPSLASESR